MNAEPVLIGTSGYSYPHWKGPFYPTDLSQSKWLRYYAEHFNTVEINMTFYREPTATTLENWKRQVPPDFRFTLKASKVITHIERIKNCRESLMRMWHSFAPLQEQLNCVLFQLPPSLKLDHALLKNFLDELEWSKREWHGISPRIALEFRHRSWYISPILVMLRDHGIAIVTHDMPNHGHWKPGYDENGHESFFFTQRDRLPLDTWIDLGKDSFFYIRLHGNVLGTAWNEYGQEFLDPWVQVATAAMETGQAVYTYFNNDPNANAVRDALRLSDTLGVSKKSVALIP